MYLYTSEYNYTSLDLHGRPMFTEKIAHIERVGREIHNGCTYKQRDFTLHK